jgi:hypothetical protein
VKPRNSTPHNEKAGSDTLGHEDKSTGTIVVMKGRARLAARRSKGEYLPIDA